MNVKEMAMDIARNCYVPDNPSSDDVREVVEKAAFDMANRILSKVQVVSIQRAVDKNTLDFSIPYVQENFEKWVDEQLAAELCRELIKKRFVESKTEDSRDVVLFKMKVYVLKK